MRVSTLLLLLAPTALVSGICRFGRPPAAELAWLDAVFLTSAAAAVALTVLLLAGWLHRMVHSRLHDEEALARMRERRPDDPDAPVSRSPGRDP